MEYCIRNQDIVLHHPAKIRRIQILKNRCKRIDSQTHYTEQKPVPESSVQTKTMTPNPNYNIDKYLKILYTK